jgi:hypothetical protein
MSALEKEFKYYLDHQDELVKKYDGRVLVIRDNAVIGDYDNFEQALFQAKEKYELGTFLIQECSPGDKDYTQTFHSRVIFY